MTRVAAETPPRSGTWAVTGDPDPRWPGRSVSLATCEAHLVEIGADAAALAALREAWALYQQTAGSGE